jgi:PAS domain S-box-containing protein
VLAAGGGSPRAAVVQQDAPASLRHAVSSTIPRASLALRAQKLRHVISIFGDKSAPSARRAHGLPVSSSLMGISSAPGELSGQWARQILETAPDAMVVVGEDGRIVFVNAQTEVLFGYKRAKLLGQCLDVLIPERFRGPHKAHLGRYFAHPGTRPMHSGLELFGRRSDGSEIAIEVSLSPVRTDDGILASAAIRDITERKRIEAAVTLNADRLGSAVESIQVAFSLFDARDRLVLCNSAYRCLVGESVSGPLIGLSHQDILDGWLGSIAFTNDDERVRFCAAQLGDRQDPKGPVDIRTRDGRSLRITHRRTVERGLVETIWDLTDDVRREEELLKARAAAEAGSAAKTEFLSSMSHELRTPLNAILGFSQLLSRDKKEPLSARHASRVEQILEGGQHLLRLVDDILDLSRIESGGMSISTEQVGVSEVLDDVKRALEATAAAVAVRLEVDPVPSEVPMVRADRTRLMQILMNYGSNAIKYNRKGGTVTLSVAFIQPERGDTNASPPNEGFVRVTVRDTGHGIPLNKQASLFQPFQRAGQETGPIEGTGIGLVIAKRLAELMLGHVGFRSVPGKGSEFWVDIPAQASGVKVTRSPIPDNRSMRTDSDERRLVLYVEDNPANVALMQDVMKGLGSFDVLVAPTAEMGIELARSHHPAIVILDINLPGMSGFDALRVLREGKETKEIPVIALTAAASERDKQRGVQAGFFRYLTKPMQVDELVAALEVLVAPG